LDRLVISKALWMVTHPTGFPVYDFDFRQFFNCSTPWDAPRDLPGVARIGAFDDYPSFYRECQDMGIAMVHSPEDHLRCTSLPQWYPLIEQDTPRSRWYRELPSFEEIEAHFDLPVFIKGSRQTSRHQAAASIIRDRSGYEVAVEIYRRDPILRWQDFVCREFIPLRPVSGGIAGKIPASFEFRTFWWRGELAGAGPYWIDSNKYNWTSTEREAALAVARRAAAALNCAFLVVDVAQTADGRWIVIEVNDGMESGYAGISPFALWQTVLDCEASRP
jgi:hypothetical protein